MKTITIRVSDEVRDALLRKAESEQVTLSDYVRNTLENSIFDFKGTERRTDDSAPESLSPVERLQLSLLHRILARVLPEDANGVDGDSEHQLGLAEVLEKGFTGEYGTEFVGIEPEISKHDSGFVMDVLDMFRALFGSIAALEEDGTALDETLKRRLSFSGLDGNDPLESQLGEYVRFLVEDDRWTENAEFVLGPAKGNSHARMVPVYSRMLTQYRAIRQSRPQGYTRASYLLTLEELQAVEKASIHPDNR